MPPVTMNLDYLKKRAKSANIFDTLRKKTQFSVSPVRFRFNKFNHKTLGVIHPLTSARAPIQPKKGTISQAAVYVPGDADYLELNGRKCPITNVEPDIVYTKQDRAQLDQHLIQPFFYIQSLFPRGREPSETALHHPDVFVDFTTLPESKRKNRNLTNTDYIMILKSMTKQERADFYSKSLNINVEFGVIFKRFIEALVRKNLISKKYKMSMQNPRIPRKELLKYCQNMKLVSDLLDPSKPIVKVTKVNKYGREKAVKEFEQYPISQEGMHTFFSHLEYEKKHIDRDIQILFTNVNLGSSPMAMIIKQKGDKSQPVNISLISFLYNVEKYMRLKYKVKNIFSINAAKLRNVYIKFSMYPFLGEGWRTFKKCLTHLRHAEELRGIQLESYKTMLAKRDQLLKVKRIWAKHLQKTPLQYLLLKFNQIKEVYVDTINYSTNRIEAYNQFQESLFKHKREIIQSLRNSRVIADYSTNLLTEEVTLSEAVEFMLQNMYNKQSIDLIIEMLNKTLKFYGFQVPPKKSKYVLSPQVGAEEKLTQQQIQQHLAYYTEEQQQEWGIFKAFLIEFHDFFEEKLHMPEDRLKNVRKEWECNMVGEWLVKKVKKLDKALVRMLCQSVSILRSTQDEKTILDILSQENKLSFSQFLSEEIRKEVQQFIERDLTKQHNLELTAPPWDKELDQAIQNYRVIASELQQAINQSEPKVQEQIFTSAAQLIDEPAEKRKAEKRVEKPSAQSKIEAQIVQEIPKLQQDRQIEDAQKKNAAKPKDKKEAKKRGQQPEASNEQLKNSPAPQLTQKVTSKGIEKFSTGEPAPSLQNSTLLSERELDLKIQQAQKKQLQIFQTIGRIRDYQSFNNF